MVTVPRFSSNVTDPVADLLTRIRNANTAYKEELLVPASKLSEAFLAILQKEGFIEGFSREGEGVASALRIQLKYSKQRQRAISGLKRSGCDPGRCKCKLTDLLSPNLSSIFHQLARLFAVHSPETVGNLQ